MSKTLGTFVCCHSPGAWAALPAAVAGIAGPAPAGAVSSGGAGWGGAGAAAAIRTSHPFDSVNPRGGGAASAGAADAAAAASATADALRTGERRIKATTVARCEDRV